MAFSDAGFQLGGSETTVATVFSLLVPGVVYVTDDNDISSMDEFYTATLFGTVLLTLAPADAGHPAGASGGGSGHHLRVVMAEHPLSSVRNGTAEN